MTHLHQSSYLEGLRCHMGLSCSGSALGGWGLLKKVFDKLIFRVRFLVLKGYSDLLFITELIVMIDYEVSHKNQAFSAACKKFIQGLSTNVQPLTCSGY